MTTPPNRRWYQFNLRTLFVVITGVAIVCALMFDRQRLIRERDDAETNAKRSQHDFETMQDTLHQAIEYWRLRAVAAEARAAGPNKRAKSVEQSTR